MLSEPIYDVDEADKLMSAMVKHFPDSDQTVGEASRFLYGSPKGGVLIPLGNILDIEVARELVPPSASRREESPPNRQRAYRPAPEGRKYTVL